MKYYTCTIFSNSSIDRIYKVTTTSAMKCANLYGRCEFGEQVIVSNGSKEISRVIWNSEESKYIRVCI